MNEKSRKNVKKAATFAQAGIVGLFFKEFGKRFFKQGDQTKAGGRFCVRRKVILPLFVLIRRVLHTFFIEFLYHAVKLSLPHSLEPLRLAKPFDESRADSIVGADKQSAVPRCAERIVAIAAESPNLRAVV